MAAQQEVIKSFMKSLDETTKSGTAALNEAVAALTNNAVTSIQTIINQMVADCKETANATKFLSDYCGINLSNTDTGAITLRMLLMKQALMLKIIATVSR